MASDASLPRIGITLGDPAGIGPEIVLKSLQHDAIRRICRPLVIGSREVLEREAQAMDLPVTFTDAEATDDYVTAPSHIPVLDVATDGIASIVKGKVSAEAGRASYAYVLKAIELARAGVIDVIATAPVTKESFVLAGVPHVDHTQILAAHASGRGVTLLATRQLRVSHVMRHLSLSDSVTKLTREKIVETIVDTAHGVASAYGIDPVRVMVAGLNPHNGDGGLMGDEETRVVAPAIAEARAAGIQCWGPVPADSAFPKAILGEADVVIALYHDQGHIAVKTNNWRQSIGITVGLDILRTSADHGSALDIAGMGIAHEDSMMESIYAAADMVRRRRRGTESGRSARQRRIVLDAAIPFATDAFATIGDLVAVPGRSIDRAALTGAEMLIVRTITRVTADLLKGTGVQFVGTATAGTDHIDVESLRPLGVTVADAAGCNARAVAQYVTAALLHLSARRGLRLAGRTLGVIGVGHVGSQVVDIAHALGMNILQNDPPLQRRTASADFVDLRRLLAESDIVTLHVPLTRAGSDPTWHLIGRRQIAAMKDGAVLINTSRGEVVDNVALLDALRWKKLAGAVLDVWEGEPVLDARLAETVILGTPHIAGYTHQAKARATKMVLDEACRFLGVAPRWNATAEIKGMRGEPIRWDAPAGAPLEDALHHLVKKVHDIESEHDALRSLLQLAPGERARCYDALRTAYPYRNEFACVKFTGAVSDERRKAAEALGFRL